MLQQESNQRGNVTQYKDTNKSPNLDFLTFLFNFIFVVLIIKANTRTMITVFKVFNSTAGLIKKDIQDNDLELAKKHGWEIYVEPTPPVEISAKTRALIDGKSK
jgi:hypothetical protein